MDIDASPAGAATAAATVATIVQNGAKNKGSGRTRSGSTSSVCSIFLFISHFVLLFWFSHLFWQLM